MFCSIRATISGLGPVEVCVGCGVLGVFNIFFTGLSCRRVVVVFAFTACWTLKAFKIGASFAALASLAACFLLLRDDVKPADLLEAFDLFDRCVVCDEIDKDALATDPLSSPVVGCAVSWDWDSWI